MWQIHWFRAAFQLHRAAREMQEWVWMVRQKEHWLRFSLYLSVSSLFYFESPKACKFRNMSLANLHSTDSIFKLFLLQIWTRGEDRNPCCSWQLNLNLIKPTSFCGDSDTKFQGNLLSSFGGKSMRTAWRTKGIFQLYYHFTSFRKHKNERS
jgi:hypothetical protein